MTQDSTPSSNSSQRLRRVAAGLGVIGVLLIVSSFFLPFEQGTYEYFTPGGILGGSSPFTFDAPTNLVMVGIDRSSSDIHALLLLPLFVVALLLAFVLLLKERPSGFSWGYIVSGFLFLSLYAWVLSSGAYRGGYYTSPAESVYSGIYAVSVTHKIGWYVTIGGSILLGLSLLSVAGEEIRFIRQQSPSIRKLERNKDVPGLIALLYTEKEVRTFYDGSLSYAEYEVGGEVRPRVAAALARIGPSLLLTGGEGAQVALGMICDPRAIELLIAALTDQHEQVRDRAADALRTIGRSDVRALRKIGTSAATALITALADQDERVRESAAEMLGGIRDPRAIEPLKAALNDQDGRVRESAARALRRLKIHARENL